MTWTQHGLSLLEVVISLALGVLLVGAAFKLLESAERAYSTQHAVADVQDRAILSLRYIATEIRRSHHALAVSIHDQQVYAGLVLSAHAEPLVPSDVQLQNPTQIKSPAQGNYPAQLQGVLPVTDTASGPSHLSDIQTGQALASDQLVIQFYAETAGIDCEGHQYQAGQFVVERFFLRPDALNQQQDKATVLALACEAGGYDQQAKYILKNPMQAGQSFGRSLGAVIIPYVEHFKILFAIADEQRSQGFAYISSQEYLALSQRPRPQIYAVQLGLLLRSDHVITASSNHASQFQILQQSVQLALPNDAQQRQQYLYRVLEHSVALERRLMIVEEEP